MDNNGSEIQRRFTPTRESLSYMRAFRDRLPEIQTQIPELKGIAFFGSRTIGQERTDASKPSDLDLVVFYDGTDFEVDDQTLQ